MSVDFSQKFPVEVTIYTLSFLGLQDLGHCACLNSKWNLLAKSDVLWRGLTKRIFGAGIETPDYKKYIKEHSVQSNEEIVKRIEAFLRTVVVGKSGEFRCTFRGGQELKIELSKESRKPFSPLKEEKFHECLYATHEIGKGNFQTLDPQIRCVMNSHSDWRNATLKQRGKNALAVGLLRKCSRICTQDFCTYDMKRRRAFSQFHAVLSFPAVGELQPTRRVPSHSPHSILERKIIDLIQIRLDGLVQEERKRPFQNLG